MTPRKPFEFHHSDFKQAEEYTLEPADCARIANAKLREWLDAAPVVHVTKESGNLIIWNNFWPVGAHKARLVEIEEIQKSGSDILKDRYVKGDPKREADLAQERLDAAERPVTGLSDS